ncbi:transglycosylase SLT domain-containing protein [Erwiniaceae bacterium L1_54_6]|nr:transglycosylase SLT domain-containing protein [Erwiniaceae bacterium L1_54_6]
MELSDDVKILIRNTAPTLLTALALPPPFNLIASTVVATALNKYLPPLADKIGDGTTIPAATPDQVVSAIKNNVSDPQLTIDLRDAEISLKKYELNAGVRFAEIQAEDKKSSRDFQMSANISARVFDSGMILIYIALGGLGLVIIGALYLILKGVEFDPSKANLVSAAFGLVGTIVGFINGIAANVVSFYWGSSQGSKEKGDEISKLVQNFGNTLASQAENASPPPVPEAQPRAKPDKSLSTPLTVPTDLSVIFAELEKLKENHSYADKSVSWKIVEQGISIDNNAPQGSGGQLVTVPAIWKSFGDLCIKYAKRYNVPVELIVATIAVESAGKPNASRIENQIHDESIGLMQTLVGTARSTLGLSDLKREQLFDPDMSINAGTAYIAQAIKTTRYDPPKVAAAYNAGSLYLDDAAENRWKMRCYPPHTGYHIDKFVGFFNDCMLLSAQQDWSNGNMVPSFHTMFAAKAAPENTLL